MSEDCNAPQPGGHGRCTRDANHWGQRHQYTQFSYQRDKPAPPPVEWGEPAVRPPKITPEQATARWGPFPKKCTDRNSGKHRMNYTFPTNMTGHRRDLFPVEYIGITQGTLCADCHGYDPRPVCCADVTREWASGRCQRKAVAYDDVPKSGSGFGRLTMWEKDSGKKAWYCGAHAPSIRAAKAAERAAERRVHEDRREREHEEDAAGRKVVEEAKRWLVDEAATSEEGFCDYECEHHECRLARVVQRYERAVEATKAAREAERIAG